MKRSDFLKLSCTGCLLSAAGIAGVATLLESCSPKGGGSVYKAVMTDKKLPVPMAAVAKDKVTIVRGKGMDYDVAVHPLGEGKYEALLLRCTHFSNPLIVNGESYSCALHGSQFGADGAVKKGPASRPLQKLPCEVEGQNLVIHV